MKLFGLFLIFAGALGYGNQLRLQRRKRIQVLRGLIWFYTYAEGEISKRRSSMTHILRFGGEQMHSPIGEAFVNCAKKLEFSKETDYERAWEQSMQEVIRKEKLGTEEAQDLLLLGKQSSANAVLKGEEMKMHQEFCRNLCVRLQEDMRQKERAFVYCGAAIGLMIGIALY